MKQVTLKKQEKNSENKDLGIVYDKSEFVSEIKQILSQAREIAYTAVNSAMVQAYWLVGKRIVEEEQGGKERAEYGEYLIKNLSDELIKEYGKGFSVQSLKNFRQFYQVFPKLMKSSTLQSQSTLSKSSTLWSQLSWSHFKIIMRVSNSKAREYYVQETAKNSWSVRMLDRNISSQYYERLLASQIKEPVVSEMKEKNALLQNDKYEFIKNPSVLEFLNLPDNMGHTEAQIEKAIIDNLQNFLLELGKGYAFVERQKLIRTEARDYYIDLVFYNFILRCFVLIDLKTTRITHQDVGQMDMYVRMFNDKIKGKDDNPTLGIVLCSETDQDIARYSILKGNEQIFASKYKLYLPTEKELIAEIERQKDILKLQFGNSEAK